MADILCFQSSLRESLISLSVLLDCKFSEVVIMPFVFSVTRQHGQHLDSVWRRVNVIYWVNGNLDLSSGNRRLAGLQDSWWSKFSLPLNMRKSRLREVTWLSQGHLHNWVRPEPNLRPSKNLLVKWLLSSSFFVTSLNTPEDLFHSVDMMGHASLIFCLNSCYARTTK